MKREKAREREVRCIYDFQTRNRAAVRALGRFPCLTGGGRETEREREREQEESERATRREMDALTHIRARTQGFEGKLKEAGFEVSVSPIPMSAQVHQVLLMRAHAARVERAGARVIL